MASIFEQLGYNYTPTGNEIVEFSQEVLDSMNAVPDLLNSWQYEDLRNNDTARSNYFVNPVSTISSLIRDVCISINDSCLEGEYPDITTIEGLGDVQIAAEAAANAANNFIDHTNRIAGLSEIGATTALLPHYDTAIGIGKSVMYLVYQSDHIQNNAPIMGSFTSLFIEQLLTNNYNVIINYPTLIDDSITTYAPDPLDPGTVVTTTDLTEGEISDIVDNISAVSSLMDTRRVHDVNYYTNCNTLLSNFNRQKAFKSPGTSERDLFNNYIGTERLKNNLANTA